MSGDSGAGQSLLVDKDEFQKIQSRGRLATVHHYKEESKLFQFKNNLLICILTNSTSVPRVVHSYGEIQFVSQNVPEN